MADKKISQLTGATIPLAGSEVLPIVQGGSTVKVSVDNLTAGKTVKAATFDTDVAAAKLTLSGTTLAGAGTDATVNLVLTPKGNGVVLVGNTASFGVGSFEANSIQAKGQFVFAANNTGSANNRNWQISANTSEAGSLDFGDSSTNTGWPNNAFRLSLLSNGNVRIPNGNLVPATAGTGIDFSANTGAAGETSSLLNWYEEGTWTPVVKDAAAGNAASAAAAGGFYTRIGRMVHFTVRIININTTGLTAGNQIYVTGLPFPAASDVRAAAPFLVEANDVSSTAGLLYAHLDNNVSYFVLFNGTTTGQSNAIVSQITSASGQLWFSGSYVTS